MEMRKRGHAFKKADSSVTGQQIALWRTSSRMAGGEGGFRESSENLEEHAQALASIREKRRGKKGESCAFLSNAERWKVTGPPDGSSVGDCTGDKYPPLREFLPPPNHYLG